MPQAADEGCRSAAAAAARGVDTGAGERVLSWLRRAWRAARQVFYGMTTFDWVRDLRRGRAEAETLFLLIAFGDLVGLPLLPPYYSLRLLPYALPGLERWKRAVLRERDWTDLIGLIEGAE